MLFVLTRGGLVILKGGVSNCLTLKRKPKSGKKLLLTVMPELSVCISISWK